MKPLPPDDRGISRFPKFHMLVGASLLCATTFISPAAANWPDGPIRLIVPYPPGGTSDNIPRALQPALERALGTNIVIENIGGGGGTIGLNRLAGFEADGSVFAFVPTATLAVAPHMHAVQYDPLTSFEAVANAAESYGILAVRPDFPAETLEEFIAYAQQNPGEITVGSAGLATITHLYAEVFSDIVGVEMLHVPYQGSALAMNDLMGGHIDAQFDAVLLRPAQAGDVKPLVGLNDVRWQGLPDLPTMAEAGINQFGVTSWFGYIAPAGVDPEIIEKFSLAVAEALEDESVKKTLEELGMRGLYLPSDEFAERIAADHSTFGELIERLNLGE